MRTLESSKIGALNGLTLLEEVVKIYVPSTIGKKHIDNQKYVEIISKRLSDHFGGATSIEGVGSWIDDNGILVQEKVNIVYAYTDKLNNSKIEKVLELCHWLKNGMSQYCISLEINNKLYFV